MIAKLASGGSQKSSSSTTTVTGVAAALALKTSDSASQSKRKRTKLIDFLLNTNWSKQNQQANNLIKLNKILLGLDPNFLDEKTGESPLSLAINSQQINNPLSSASAYHSPTATLGCTQSASLFNIQNQNPSISHNILTLRQTNVSDLSQSKAPLVERILLLLIKNGAKVDFRNDDSRTPLHVAAMKSNFWALKTLLDLGASNSYRDINGLTPLYYSILHSAELKITQILLNNSTNAASNYRNPSNLASVSNGLGNRTLANCMERNNNSTNSSSNNNNVNSHNQDRNIGITDQQGWQEVHHACKLGLDAHLDKLLYYGCDINAKISGSGNTPLHVAAINDQLNCAKVLLLRGADKTITNNSHQTAHQVAVIANNMDLAEFIAEHDETKVVPFTERTAPIVTPVGAFPPGNAIAGSAAYMNRHSFALPKAYNGLNHSLNRFSISSSHNLVNSQSSSNLEQHQTRTQQQAQYDKSTSQMMHQHPSSHHRLQQDHQNERYQSSTLSRATGIVQPQQRPMNPLVLDVSGSHNQDSGSAASSAPTSTSGISSGGDHSGNGGSGVNLAVAGGPNACGAPVAQISLLSINANQPPQMNNISPSLSQRSCATTNTTATSSSGVCCDGDANICTDELAQTQGRHSNITIISIGNNTNGPNHNVGSSNVNSSMTNTNSLDRTNSNNNNITSIQSKNISNRRSQFYGDATIRVTTGMNSFMPQKESDRLSTADSVSAAAAVAAKQINISKPTNESGSEFGGRASTTGHLYEDENEACAEAVAVGEMRGVTGRSELGEVEEDDEDPRSSGSSNGLQSLMSDERPLYVGSIVEATSEYQSGDPNHLQLRRGNLIEILEYPPELIQGGQLPRLANKPMLFGRRKPDGAQGLFPSFCVQRTKQKLSSLRQRIAQTNSTNARGVIDQHCNGPMNAGESWAAMPNRESFPESQSMITITNEISQPVNASPQISRHESEWAPTTFLEKQVKLFKINEGFGFVLRGARINLATLKQDQANKIAPGKISIDERLMAANNLASLQYLDDIESGSVADQAGLKRGDFLVAVNQQDVRLCSHEQVVHMIRQSGDQVHLTIASPVQTAINQHSIYATGTRTLGRKKPEPPKRDPTTTLTRNKTNRMGPNQNNSTLFDSSKPLPQTPSDRKDDRVNSPSNSSMNRSFSSQFAANSIQSLSSGIPETQSITSVSTIDSNNSNVKYNSEHTPIQSSSSTTTLTTVATTKPKAPSKPSHLKGLTNNTNTSPPSNQPTYQSAAIITTTTNKRASQPTCSMDTSMRSITNPSQQVASVPQPPPPPPPPPPPMPHFSPGKPSEVKALIQRRISAPINQLPDLSAKQKTLKRRESLASDCKASPAAANISSVAAACAAAANSRLLRQQKQQEEQKRKEQQDNKEREINDDQSKTLPVPVMKSASMKGVAAASVEEEATDFPPPPPSLSPPPPPLPPASLTTAEAQNEANPPKERRIDDQEASSALMARKQAMLSATLGRKFPAQIIQQTKAQQMSQSHTLRSKPKRPTILNYADELPPPPAIPQQPKLSATAVQVAGSVDMSQRQVMAVIDQQVVVDNFECQHHHNNHNKSSKRVDELVQEMREYEQSCETNQQILLMKQQQQQQLRQQQLLQQQHQRILRQQQQQQQPVPQNTCYSQQQFYRMEHNQSAHNNGNMILRTGQHQHQQQQQHLHTKPDHQHDAHQDLSLEGATTGAVVGTVATGSAIARSQASVSRANLHQQRYSQHAHPQPLHDSQMIANHQQQTRRNRHEHSHQHQHRHHHHHHQHPSQTQHHHHNHHPHQHHQHHNHQNDHVDHQDDLTMAVIPTQQQQSQYNHQHNHNASHKQQIQQNGRMGQSYYPHPHQHPHHQQQQQQQHQHHHHQNSNHADAQQYTQILPDHHYMISHERELLQHDERLCQQRQQLINNGSRYMPV